MSKYNDDQLKKAFNEMDADGSGFICRKEVAATLEKLGLNAADSSAAAGRIMKEDDPNGDGKITFDEFKQCMV